MSLNPTPGGDIRVVAFEPRHGAAFRDLNLAWIERYFAVEDKDRYMLDHPDETIIAKGGHILMAEDEGGDAVGCVCLLPYSEGVLELAKMAVADGLQGRGVGGGLMAATVARAKAMGARALYLETNDGLGPAVRLYERTGFRHLPQDQRPHSPYVRCNVYMRLDLDPATGPVTGSTPGPGAAAGGCL